jgi:hypothetical protein
MAKSKKALPEITVTKVTNAGLVAKAAEALALRTRIAELTAQETELKKALADAAVIVRRTEEGKGNYIGLVKITDAEQSTVQVQFKIQNGALRVEPESEATLLAHYGSARPLFFEKDVVITSIPDPDALIADLKAKGQNPWDLLELKVKPGVDRALASSPHIIKDEAFLPVEGFLATSNEMKHTFSKEAKAFHTEYLERVLKPAVSLGNK